MVHAGGGPRRRCVLRFTGPKVQQRHAVMLVIVGEKAEAVVTMLYPGFKHLLIPFDHLVVAMRLVYHVAEFARRGHGGLPLAAGDPGFYYNRFGKDAQASDDAARRAGHSASQHTINVLEVGRLGGASS